MKIIKIAQDESYNVDSYWIDPSGVKIPAPDGHRRSIPIMAQRYNLEKQTSIPEGMMDRNRFYENTFLRMYERGFLRVSVVSKTLGIEGKNITSVNEAQKRTLLNMSREMTSIIVSFDDFGHKSLRNTSELNGVLSGDRRRLAAVDGAYWMAPNGELLRVRGLHGEAVPQLVRHYKLGNLEFYTKDGFHEFFKKGFVRIYSYSRNLNLAVYISSLTQTQKEKLMGLARGLKTYIDDVENLISYKDLTEEDVFKVLNGNAKGIYAYFSNKNDWYKVASKLFDNEYIILGLTDETGSESQKAAPGTFHYEVSWSKSISFSYHWVYYPAKNSIFSWDNLNQWQIDSITENLKNQHGIINPDFGDSVSRFAPIKNELEENKSGLAIEAASNDWDRYAAWYKKEPPSPPKAYNIARVSQDVPELIESLRNEYIIAQTPYDALQKFLRKFSFLYDYAELGVTLMTVVDEIHTREVQEKYQRKLDEKERIKREKELTRMKGTWYGND